MKRNAQQIDPNISMPSDQFGRYGIVAEKIKKLAKFRKQSHITILDVGGFKGEIHNFFNKSEASITIIDLFDSDQKNYVKGSALAMPFEDNSFDYVVSFEVFEHISRPDRKKFIQECVRVSKNEFLLTAPFSGKNNEVLNSEKLVNELWKEMYHKDHIWLYEHISYGTPSEQDLEKILDENGLVFRKYGDNDLLLWNLMLSFNYLTTLFRGSGLNPDVQIFYNTYRSTFDSDTNSHYRKIYVIGKTIPQVLDQDKKNIITDDKPQLVNQLINSIFITIAKDIKKQKDHHRKELKKVSSLLEERIKMYDELVAEHSKLQKKYSEALHVKVKNRIKKIIKEK